MKKVRFESPTSFKVFQMDETDCHFPRPFIERCTSSIPSYLTKTQNETLEPDPIHTYEYSNATPYPSASKTLLSDIIDVENRFSPSEDLNLSMLDSSCQVLKVNHVNLKGGPKSIRKPFSVVSQIASPESKQVLMSSPNIPNRNDDFFLRREKSLNVYARDAPYYSGNDKSSFQVSGSADKENTPIYFKQEVKQNSYESHKVPIDKSCEDHNLGSDNCMLHNSIKLISKTRPCKCVLEIQKCYPVCECKMQTLNHMRYIHYNDTSSDPSSKDIPQNAVDKKSWLINRFHQSDQDCDLDVGRLDKKRQRDPTVLDLFKIIKLQNEQLQVLQQKVDKLIDNKKDYEPLTNYVTEHVALEAVQDKKTSVGVMTSFEMVRTSTIINKEIISKNEAQIQCNRSQISIKEVLSKSKPEHINFLDDIPMTNDNETIRTTGNYCEDGRIYDTDMIKDTDNDIDDKTLNELSLYNVQVDNATTPQMSPERSLYLDVRDYSDSDSGSGDEQTNVGWTYYNKVMSHVNGILHESDMPSSASALYRNTRLQMKIDRTNVSIAKRVTFDDNALGVQIQQHNIGSTDTSLKMKQLATKYLKSRDVVSKPTQPTTQPPDMSYATRNYMEKHKLIQGGAKVTDNSLDGLPKFLDITALKRQPKFL